MDVISSQHDSVELAAIDPQTGFWTVEAVEGVLEGRSRSAEDSLDFDTVDGEPLPLVGVPARIGAYVIERMIGRGGMGRVYMAKHETMQRSVAIKTLPHEQAERPSAVARFYEEVRAAARLMHPNIATAFDAGFSQGVHYLAMEYINGSTLTSLVVSNGPFQISDAVAAIQGAAKGLAHAHATGVIHRDVKPSNLMKGIDGTIKVVDLGLALFANPQEILKSKRGNIAHGGGRVLGTIAFMSPEQLENPDYVDARSDIYSLGSTLYFLLTGRSPYEGEFLEQIQNIRHAPPPELFAVRPDVDIRLEHIFRRMMAKRPQERYTSMVELLADLESHETSATGTSWIAQVGQPRFVVDKSTYRGWGSQAETNKVLGIDFGLFYATSAIADSSGTVSVITPSNTQSPQMRLAMADGNPIVFGEAAASRRAQHPGGVLHCVPLYIGQVKVEHLINERQCPAEVLMAMQIRKVIQSTWSDKKFPLAVAVTVPSTYDQFHRQAIIRAVNIAGVASVRLVDRSLAGIQAWRHYQWMNVEPGKSASSDEGDGGRRQAIQESIDRPLAMVSVTGLATEVTIARHRAGRTQQLSAIGQWHYGTLQWQQKLVDLVAERCVHQYRFDPRLTLQTAGPLQVACERALPKFLLLESVNVAFQGRNQSVVVSVSRSDWLNSCEPLLVELTHMIEKAIVSAAIDREQIGHCLLLGFLTRLPEIRNRLMASFNSKVEFVNLDRSDLARGAALCLAGELPGRGDLPLPPQTATAHDFGLLVIDERNRQRIRPIIPRGTAIPARTHRRIASIATGPQSLTVVESSTWRETAWRSLGSHLIESSVSGSYLELIFEVDADARLVIRRRDPVSGVSHRLPQLPSPRLTPAEVQDWTEWIQTTEKR